MFKMFYYPRRRGFRRRPTKPKKRRRPAPPAGPQCRAARAGRGPLPDGRPDGQHGQHGGGGAERAGVEGGVVRVEVGGAGGGECRRDGSAEEALGEGEVGVGGAEREELGAEAQLREDAAEAPHVGRVRPARLRPFSDFGF